ncbi:ATP-dependent Clp protease adapter ClpS [Natronogracilivirga saccharolytica]|uniref:ATP-dependent Clp protease adapter protein ClpS n=1 Tax=Natronogracilivirga saccharolytica TaxID=2812953 RepID=A0A8J7S3A7_9BACT|nr:ATP-dependent Clp protease adapter ClpS [Natronogracilivirga saccharolytica]MBP3191263.1 ATP-dependent Clp protease adapter ClpS [Natronogracilivirga saccharolytica]
MPDTEFQDQTKTREKTREKITEPPMYKVILLNDDYTTFDFVVSVLTGIFGKSVPEAVAITNDVHRKGSGVCGIYTRDIAETKVDMVARSSKEAGFPLRCTMEET